MAHLAVTSGLAMPPMALRRALAELAPGAPIVLMVHGFRYCPHDPQNDPHRSLLSPQPRAEGAWPAALGLCGGEGLSIGFGWSALGTIWDAYGALERAAEDLAALIATLEQIAPGHPLHLIGHSLGARLVLHGLKRSPRGAVARAILIAPAVFRSEAAAIMDQPNLAMTQIFSVLSRENTAFDMLLRAALPREGATLGRGGPAQENWLDLRLDAPHVQEVFAALGWPLDGARRLICHGSGYRRAGVWPLYRALLTRPDLLCQSRLRARLAPAQRQRAPLQTVWWRA